MRINGEFTTTHLLEHRLAIIANDYGNPPLETRGLVIVNIKDYSNLSTTTNYNTNKLSKYQNRVDISGDSDSRASSSAGVDEIPKQNQASIATVLFSQATLPFTGKLLFCYNNFFLELISPAPFFAIVEPEASALITKKHKKDSKEIHEEKPFTDSKRLAPIFTNPEISVDVEENIEDAEILILEAKYPDGDLGSITYVIEFGDTSLFK